ncbi:MULTISPECIES: WD40 repeat domain-containing protein [Actinoplanes]|uniref:WD40 repeat domain-containing protein n=1 Tax=Actinoplanes TaxID=1865 RepID=UPI0005F2851E|nr:MULTISPECIES: WD40 repeat domain-containing protein [Actinoplanes]
MAFRSDAQQLAVVTPNRMMTLWNTADPAEPRRLGRFRYGRGIYAAAWNPVAVSLLATASVDGMTTVWRFLDDRQPEQLAAWQSPVTAQHIGWSPAGQWVFSVAPSGVASVWDMRSSYNVGQADLTGGRQVVAVYGVDDTIVVIAEDGWARWWSPRTRTGEWVRLTGAPVRACAHAGGLLVVTGVDGTLACFDARLDPAGELRVDHTQTYAVACTGDGRLVIAFGSGNVVAIGSDGDILWQLDAGPLTMVGVAIAGDLVAIGSGTARPYLVSLATGAALGGTGSGL